MSWHIDSETLARYASGADHVAPSRPPPRRT